MHGLMNRIRGVCSKLRLIPKAIAREGKGQSLIVIVFALLGLLAFTGLAVDLGLVYSERVRIGRACDAAALAGVRELPEEYDAAQRALEYLSLNGYDVANARIEIYYCSDTDVSGDSGAATTFKINTTDYEEDVECNTASRLRVEGIQQVRMNFMQFFGFDYAPVSGDAIAENVSDLDVAVVFDKSGSMEFDTLCYGCWRPSSDGPYPIGERPYMSWPPADNICDPTDYDRNKYGSLYYNETIIEAEDYSHNHSVWNRDYAVKGIAHWTLQRNGKGSKSHDSFGGYMMVTPYYYSTYEEGATELSGEHGITAQTPRLEYDFHTPDGSGTEGGPGNYYIYLRAQGGRNPRCTCGDPTCQCDVDPRDVHWGVTDREAGGALVDGDSARFSQYSNAYDGANSSNWRWGRIGPVTLDGDHDYRLNLWVGGLGFCLDRVIITKDSNCTSNNHACDKFSGQGLDPTPGRTRDACSECDPRYGQEVPGVCNTAGDDLWDDEQPVRAAKQAVKRFIDRLDPALDQVAYVHYSTADSTNTKIASQLYCKRKLGDSCNDFDYVLDKIEDTQAGGSTAMADGMRLGIETLRTDGSCSGSNPGTPCGRASAAHIMIVMTDGVANDYTSACNAAPDLWPSGGKAQDCVVWQAQRARDNGIIIYAISLGLGADFELMQEIADITKGEHFYAPDTDSLDYIFDTIFDRIFLRLIR